MRAVKGIWGIKYVQDRYRARVNQQNQHIFSQGRTLINLRRSLLAANMPDDRSIEVSLELWPFLSRKIYVEIIIR